MSAIGHTFLRPNGSLADASQNVAVGGSSTASSVLSGTQACVRLVATTDCYIDIDGTAAAGDMLIPAGVPEYIEITGRVTISCIQVSASGVLNITEMVK